MINLIAQVYPFRVLSCFELTEMNIVKSAQNLTKSQNIYTYLNLRQIITPVTYGMKCIIFRNFMIQEMQRMKSHLYIIMVLTIFTIHINLNCL